MAIYRPPLDDGAHAATEDRGRARSADNSAPQDDPRDRKDDARDGGDDDGAPGGHPSSLALAEIMEHPRLRYFNKFRLLCGDVVNQPKVQMTIILFIVINAAMMGIATFDFVEDNDRIDYIFEKTDEAFLIIFTIELILQFIYRGYTMFMDGWLVFDFVIIVLSWTFAEFQVIRAFRIFRALRIITRIETMRNLVTALFDIMPRLGAICALLLLIFYIFAVLFTQLFGELELSDDYFSRLDYSLLTLFVMMTMEWADVARECMVHYWWAWAPFIAFIMITGFIVFNLIIAVVCDAVAVIENKDDLAPDDFFGGMMLGNKSADGTDGMAGGMMPAPATYEEELVENLAERIASVLARQKEMLASLESLTKDSLGPVPSTPPVRRANSCEDD